MDCFLFLAHVPFSHSSRLVVFIVGLFVGTSTPFFKNPGTILVLDCNFLVDCFVKAPQFILDIAKTPAVTLTITLSQVCLRGLF